METASDGVTPLHWAAINNRLNICRYLLDQGATVDAKGGGIQGTPLHWACRNGLVYIAHLLISRGADPLRTDSQGFNALHLAVHSSNVLLVIYLLHLEMPVDPTDNGDRTPLHWAAYQGDALTVDALLNWGADTRPTDEKVSPHYTGPLLKAVNQQSNGLLKEVPMSLHCRQTANRPLLWLRK